MAKNEYELVVCIVNAGYAETVMDAAKDVGARGGTVINARGTANKEAEKIFNIAIQPEKEIVMILVPSKIKDDVLHAIYKLAGLKSAGKGIAFSLPVNQTVGINKAENSDNKEPAEENKKETAVAAEEK